MSWCLPALICALLVGGSLGRTLQQAPQQSDPSNTSLVKYVITGEKDADGHWTELVKMEHGEEDWHIEVDHTTLEVEEGQPKVKITATLSVKTKTPDAAAVEPQKEPKQGDSDEEEDVILQLFPHSRDWSIDWFGAKAQCEQWGGHLAVPDTSAKMIKLTSILQEHVKVIGETTGAFLGFDDLDQEGHFMTVLGKPLFGSRDSKWSPHWYQTNQPDDDKSWTKDGEDCGSLRPSGGLNDVPCRFSLPYICEKAADKEGTGNTVAAVAEVEGEVTLHLFKDSFMDWFEAGEACVKWGGTLAVPDSQEKMAKMAAMLRESNPDPSCALVGFSDIKQEGHFVTIFDKPVLSSTTSWSAYWFSHTQPDDDKSWTSEGEDCGSIHPSGGLNDVPCRQRFPYFCQKAPPSESDTTTEESQSNEEEERKGEEEEEEDKEETLRLFDRNDLDWLEASDACNEWGGHLAIPDSAEKIDLMTSTMKRNNVWNAFLGFGDQDEEGNFVTIFGQPVFSSHSWSPRWWRDDQPDDDKTLFKNGEDCGSMKGNGGLNDIPCEYHMPFFCEKPRSTGGDPTTVPYLDRETTVIASTENLLGNDETMTPVQTTKKDLSLKRHRLSEIFSRSKPIVTFVEPRVVFHSREKDSFLEELLTATEKAENLPEQMQDGQPIVDRIL